MTLIAPGLPWLKSLPSFTRESSLTRSPHVRRLPRSSSARVARVNRSRDSWGRG